MELIIIVLAFMVFVLGFFYPFEVLADRDILGWPRVILFFATGWGVLCPSAVFMVLGL